MTEKGNRSRRNIKSIIISICTGLCVIFCSGPAKVNVCVSSSGVYTAIAIPTQGAEGEGKTIIKKGNRVVAELPLVFPVSFSPTADILLVREWAPDDDCRHYLLNIGAGEFFKKGNRLDYVFGKRYVERANWSSDGKTITFHNSPELTEFPYQEETFTIEDFL